MKEIVDPRGPYLPTLNKIFLTSWVIAVITDPFFLYIPTLNQEKKCLRMDKKLEIIALVFRSFTDLSYVLHILFQLFVGLTAKTSVKSNEKKGFLNYAFKRAENVNWSYILLDVLAVLPAPQVIILVFFSKIRPFFRPSSARKIFLYIVLLFQYVPRVFQIYLSCEALKKSRDALSKTLWVRGTFNLFLYIIASHLYMQLPTQRSEDRRHNRKEEIRKIVEGKKPDIHLWASRNLCGHDAPGEVTTGITAFLQDLLETEKDLDSKKQLKKLQVLLKAKHPTKKLENGQHLSEKLGVDHPAMGFLKTIHLQLKDIISGGTKHQWSKTKESAQLWMLKNGIPKLTMLMIKQYIQHRLQNSNDDVDIVYLFSVPELQTIDDQVYEEIIKHLKPVSYAENSYIIREGEPIGHMLFVTQGVVWVFGNGAIRSVAKGDYYGEQLLEWQLRSASYTELPVSTKNVQSHTKVEGLALKAVDLNHILSKYWWKFPIAKQYEVELLKRFAAGAIGEAWQRCRSRRQKDPSLRWTALNRKITSVTAFSSTTSNPLFV
ncbi:hypothetical protein TIFTF001_013632 [Ficus carica]|uniref:Cyclic nucleotide-binding domain-containing protein n=1 Tax=Ficus carica TaxID=3494 RepID=A0AA88A4Q1_FICCA|nr:hypothetical protein TIFTF001_013632 [Ficus carica]